VLRVRSPTTGALGETQAGVVPPGVTPIRPLALGMLQWRNSRPRRVRSALGRSRRRTPSSSASGLSVISIVVGLVHRMGAHAVACDAAGGVGGVEDAGVAPNENQRGPKATICER